MNAEPKRLALALASVAFVFPLLASAAGELDPTFGSGGKVLTDVGEGEVIEALAAQRDGKIVAVGVAQDRTTLATQFALVRYESNGSLDAGFGAGGKVMTSFGGRDIGRAVAIQADGKIVAAGVASDPMNADIALARFNPDGSLDPSFGVGGKVVTDFNSTIDIAFAVAIQPDGKIVTLGYTRPFGPATTPSDFALTRYNPNGTLDNAFDGDGKVVTDFAPGSDDRGWGIALAPDGKIVAVGLQIDRATFSSYIEVARYNLDGRLDVSFDGDGMVRTTQLNNSGAYDVVVGPDGKVVVAGFVGNLALVRFNVDGRIDPSFGSNGVATASWGARSAYARGIERQPDGMLVVAGALSPDPPSGMDYAFAAARFDRTGKPDKSFYGGAISTDIAATAWDEAWDLALQPNGRIVLGGASAQIQGSNLVNFDFALARYLVPSAVVRCVVPNVKGKTVVQARRVLALKRCALGRINRVYSSKVKKGKIISQNRRLGTRFPRGTRVNVVVSRGKRPAQRR